MEITVKTDVTTEPVTLAEAKNYLKVSENVQYEDDLINILIKAARQEIEGKLNTAIASQTLTVNYRADDINDNEVRLPRAPHQIITSVKQIDNEGGETTLTVNDGYFVKGNILFEVMLQASNFGTDSTATEYNYEIEYVAGYTTVPSLLKLGILQLVKDMYDSRGAELEPKSDRIYRQLRAYSFNRFI